MKSFKEASAQMLQEASLSRVHDHVMNRPFGIISAERGERTGAENKANHAELKSAARAHGLGFIEMKGRYIENHGSEHAKPVDERSLMVIGKNPEHVKGFLQKHGAKFGQDSVLFKHPAESHAKLIGTKEGAWPGKGEQHDVGEWHANKAPEFHSVMKGRKTFAFEDVQFIRQKTFSNRGENDQDILF